MKRFYISILLLFYMATSYGHIKVVDDSYKTETATLLELNKTLYMEMFEKLFPRYEPCTYNISDLCINAVGEKFYVYEESEKQFVRINPADSTVCITSMPVGYYEITNVILTSDRLGECRDEVLKYKINQNERTSIIDRMSFSEPAVIDYSKLGRNNMLSELARRTDIILPFYTCKDSNGKLFYISAQDFYSYLTKFKYIMMSFYENVEKLKGQKIALYNSRDYIIDYISKEPIKISINDRVGAPILIKELDFDYYQAEINPNLQFLQCKDIVLKGGQILAIIEYEQGNFAVPIKDIKNWLYSVSPKIIVNMFRINDWMEFVSEQELNNVVSNFNTVQNKLRASQLKAAQKAEQAFAQYTQERLKNLTSKYGAEMASVIAEHKVKIGMTQEMCREAWGTPYETYTTTTAAGSTQIWRYGYKTRLYFVNDRLNIIQN